ncbi:MAG: hypothetical protein FJ060_11400, partial [Cyanobacteria bacterium K_Offshore_0m_m2_072]|nr:hypothetical protein [Cyanobacteria bacterium K_Offshore_0m_m2_072]
MEADRQRAAVDRLGHRPAGGPDATARAPRHAAAGEHGDRQPDRRSRALPHRPAAAAGRAAAGARGDRQPAAGGGR